MIKKLLAIILSAVMLLSLAACAAEDITPKEDEQESPDTQEEEPKEDETIPFSYGQLPIITDEFAPLWEKSAFDFQKDYGYEIFNFVNVYQAKEEYYPHLLPWFVDTLEKNNPKTESEVYMVECANRYNESFFEEKQLLTITRGSITSYGYSVHAERITPVTDENGNVTYHVQLRLKHNQFGSDAENVGASTVSIELDKDLNISRENVVVEILNK